MVNQNTDLEFLKRIWRRSWDWHQVHTFNHIFSRRSDEKPS